jgi:hypothetical protein
MIREYPVRTIDPDLCFYRIRKSINQAAEPLDYDSPPDSILGNGRFDLPGLPVLYSSPDLQVCVHECRVTAEDDLYVATLVPTSSLRFLDLSVVLEEGQRVTEFESLDIAIQMLFLAGPHAYEITRDIAGAARIAGFDGIIYPSYFSLLRLGGMPFESSVYGISNRRIPEFQKYEKAKTIPNLAIFGRPIKDGRISVRCMNRLIIRRVNYEFHFGPVAC